MVDRRLASLCLVLLAGSLPAQEPEFAATAPAKVLLPIENFDPATPEAPLAATEAEAPQDTAPTGPVVDAEMAEIGAYMDEQATSDGTEAPANGEAEPQPELATSLLQDVGGALGKILPPLFGILAFLVLAIAAAKRWGKNTPLLAGQQLARVIGRVGLSPQASLHFVQTNGEVLVVGVTQQHVSLLRTFDAKDFEVAATTPVKTIGASAASTTGTDEPAATFLAQLKESRAAMGVDAAVDDDLDQLKGELQRLKQYFQDSTRGRD